MYSSLYTLAPVIKYMRTRGFVHIKFISSTREFVHIKQKFKWSNFYNVSIQYSPLVSMCHSRKLKNQNKWVTRNLDTTVSSLCELLEKDKSVIIHERNVKIPLAEIFKVKSRLAPEIMIEVFRFKDRSYDLKNNDSTHRSNIKSCAYIRQ